MFLVNSRHHHFSAACKGSVCAHLTLTSTPSSEVTGLFCRIPWPEFSRAPWIIHPTHLSRFAVRFACTILRSFSWQHGLNTFKPCGYGLASRHCPDGFACRNCLPACTGTTNTRRAYPPASLLRAIIQVRELLTRFPSATPFSLALGAD